MPTPPLPPIGERIRAQRARRGQTVRGLAGEAGVSASLISQIETAKAQPSVSTLYAIATALGIGVEDLLSEDGDGHPQGGRDDDAAGRGARRRVGPVVRAGDPESIELETGVRWELLGQVPGVHTEFLRVTYPPGASSSSSNRLMRHPGTEYGCLVSGELVLTLAFDEHVLRPGDAVCFESRTPHSYSNHSDEPAVGIWFVREDQP